MNEFGETPEQEFANMILAMTPKEFDTWAEKMSMEEIAEKFGYTNSDNAKTQKYKCLQRLKRNFFERNEIEIT